MTLQRTLNETLAIERRERELGICLTNRWTVPFTRSRTGLLRLTSMGPLFSDAFPPGVQPPHA